MQVRGCHSCPKQCGARVIWSSRRGPHCGLQACSPACQPLACESPTCGHHSLYHVPGPTHLPAAPEAHQAVLLPQGLCTCGCLLEHPVPDILMTCSIISSYNVTSQLLCSGWHQSPAQPSLLPVPACVIPLTGLCLCSSYAMKAGALFTSVFLPSRIMPNIG